MAEPAAERVYPVVFVDAIHVKIRDGQVADRPIYVAMAVTVEGHREILGIWAGDGGEGAKFWLQVFTEIKNRGGVRAVARVAGVSETTVRNGVFELDRPVRIRSRTGVSGAPVAAASRPRNKIRPWFRRC